MTVDITPKSGESSQAKRKKSGLEWLSPLHLVFVVVIGLAAWRRARPIVDPDAFWHVVLGEEILATGTATGIGEAWAWYDPPEPWTTSQWLSEVVMAWLVAGGGWTLLVGATAAAVVLLGVILAYVVLSRAPAVPAAVLFALAASPVLFVAQVRPLTVSLIGTAIVAHAAERTLAEGRVPAWWLIPLTALWANLHGQWVLAPAVLGIAVFLYWLERPSERRGFVLRGGAVVLGVVAAGCLTPLGIRGLLLPFELGRVAGNLVQEWLPTVFWSVDVLPLLVLPAVLAAAWLRRRDSVRPVVVAYVAIWLVFSATAGRAVFVSIIILLPVVARAAGLAFPGRRQIRSRTEAGLLVTLAAASLLALGVMTAGRFVQLDPLASARGLAAAEFLSDRNTAVRVFNDYNTAGVLAYFGPSGIELVVDGRVERYGAEYLDTYFGVSALRGDEWREFLERFDPEAAVLAKNTPIRHILEDDWGWAVVTEDDDYVLLEPTR